MNKKLVLTIPLVAAGLALAVPVSAQSYSVGGPGSPQGEDLAELIEEAQASPLGSRENPVRAEMPSGQRAYLSRLRCSDGSRPAFQRVGNFGVGVFGRIIDGYQVVCRGSEPAETMVFMDMYHPGYIENEPVEGFTIQGGNTVREPVEMPTRPNPKKNPS